MQLPNIYQNMLALRNQRKSHWPSKLYPYSSERQDSRQQRTQLRTQRKAEIIASLPKYFRKSALRELLRAQRV